MKSAGKGCDANGMRGAVRDNKVWIDRPLEAKGRLSLLNRRHLLEAVKFFMLTLNKLLFYKKKYHILEPPK